MYWVENNNEYPDEPLKKINIGEYSICCLCKAKAGHILFECKTFTFYRVQDICQAIHISEDTIRKKSGYVLFKKFKISMRFGDK